jgi:hypothetical protein
VGPTASRPCRINGYRYCNRCGICSTPKRRTTSCLKVAGRLAAVEGYSHLVFFKESDNLIFVDADPKLGVSITLERRDLLSEGSVPHHAANMFARLHSSKPCSKRRED